MQYRIVEGSHQSFEGDLEDITAIDDLQTKVNHLIKKGWIPQGGICIGSDVNGDVMDTYTYLYLYQAMIHKNIFDELDHG